MIIQVFGYRGMLGGAVSSAIQFYKHELITDNSPIEGEVSIVAPVVINCAGLIKQRDASKEDFFRSNAHGVHNLSRACEAVGSRLIHVSTDCVFDGSPNVAPYDEFAEPGGIDNYSKSKVLGEVGKPHLTVRTSFVGLGTSGFLNDLISHDNKIMDVPKEAYWTGHTVYEIADILVLLASLGKDIEGILHIPAKKQSRLDMAKSLAECLGLNVQFNIVEGGIDRTIKSVRWFEEFDLPRPTSWEKQLIGLKIRWLT